MSKQITATDCKPMIIWDVTILDQTIRVEARSGYWAARKAAKAILGTESVQYDCYSTRGLAVATKMHRNYHVHLVEAAIYMAEMATIEDVRSASKTSKVAEVAIEQVAEVAIEQVAEVAIEQVAEVAIEQVAEVATEQVAEVAYDAEVEAAIERVTSEAPKFYVQTLTTTMIVEADSADMAVVVAAQTLEKVGNRLEVSKAPSLSYGETVAYRAGHRALRSGERTVYWVQRT